MNNKDMKNQMALVLNHLNMIFVQGAANAEHLVIATKLLDDLFNKLPEDEKAEITTEEGGGE